MTKDLEQFLGVIPAEPKEQLGDIDYFNLLQNTFLDLKNDLERQGNTQHFRDLQKERGAQILGFWRNQVGLYGNAVKEGKVEEGKSLVLENGVTLEVGISTDYHREDEHILHITKRGHGEEHKVAITVSEESGLDEFLHPPKVESRFDREDTDRKEYTFEIIFRGNKISTIKKTTVHVHRYYEIPYIKQEEILDTSIFGVETRAY